MAKNLRGIRALGIVGFAALTISLVSACNGNGNFTVSDSSSQGAPAAANSGQSTGSTGSTGVNSPTVDNNTGNSGANPQTTAPQTSAANRGATTDASAIPQCATRDLSAHLGAVLWSPDGAAAPQGLGRAPVIYTNISAHTCYLDGFGGVDLHGPSDPNGPVYSLRRDNDPGDPRTPQRITLKPGAQANTTIAFNTWQPGSNGSLGSTDWAPTYAVVTPPNQTTSFTLPWYHGVTVLRDDEATIPASVIYPVEAGPNPDDH